MKITRYDSTGAREADPGELPALLKDADSTLWVDMTGPTEEDIAAMREVFQFHPLAIKNTHDEHQRPKLDDFGDVLFVIVNPVTPGETHLVFRELDVFVGSHYLVTVHMGPEPVIGEARKRLVHHASEITPSYLLYALLDAVVDGYFPVLDGIGAAISTIEQSVLTSARRELLTEVLDLKRMLTNLWRVLWPQRDVAHTLIRHDLPAVDHGAMRHYLRDVSDHLEWQTDMLNHFRELLTGITDLYLSSISIRLNRSVGRLTVFAVIVGVLTVVSAFYGMNFSLTWPPYSAEWGIVVVVAIMGAISAGLLLIFNRLE